jgi:hypothetical protein
LFIHILASASTFAFLASASSRFFLNADTFSFRTRTFSLMIANSAYLASFSAVAASHFSFKGLTSLKILLNSIIFTNQAHKYLAASFWDVINVGLNFSATSGSLIILIVASKADYSIYSPSKVCTDFKNLSGLFMVYPAFFQTFSKSSLGLIFSPINVITAFAVTLTIIGGYPKFFISVTWPFFKQLIAASADFNAGTAADKAISASFYSFSAF